MKFCTQCGKQLVDEAVVCPSCGCSQGNLTPTHRDDSKSFAWALLGFFFPLIGFILYCVWYSTTPLKAHSVGKGALIGLVLPLILFIAYITIAIIMFGAYSCFNEFYF